MGITGLNVLIDPDAPMTMSDVAGIRKDPVVRGDTMHSPDPGPRPDSAQEPKEDELEPKPPVEDVEEVSEDEHDELEALGAEDVAEVEDPDDDDSVDNAEGEDEPNDLSDVDKEFTDEGEDE